MSGLMKGKMKSVQIVAPIGGFVKYVKKMDWNVFLLSKWCGAQRSALVISLSLSLSLSLSHTHTHAHAHTHTHTHARTHTHTHTQRNALVREREREREREILSRGV